MILSLILACKPETPLECEQLEASPSDDPGDWDVPPGDYTPVLSEPRFVVPSDALPVDTDVSNNNVSILLTATRMFLAWRTAPTHFASTSVELHVVSSTDGGESWEDEHTVALGSDVREPALVLWEGVVSLSFFQAGTNGFTFEPQRVYRSQRCGPGDWTDEVIDPEPRVPWDLKVRDGVLYRTSYTGHHDDFSGGAVDLHFEQSTDGGLTYAPVGEDPVYSGGNSEAAFELDETGALWAVTRNEDGDATGKGAMVCTAPADAPGAWDCPSVSDPNRYDSPEMLRHGEDLYLLARRDPDGVFGEDPNILPYSTRPKRSALYRIDRESRAVEWVFDIPGVGDTAFPQARRTGPHTFLVANYTSPLDQPDLSWLEGQTSPDGTQIYLATLEFTP